jgi:hypothetical protein
LSIPKGQSTSSITDAEHEEEAALGARYGELLTGETLRRLYEA